MVDWGKQGAGCLGADTLIQLLKNYSRSLDIKASIAVGVVGARRCTRQHLPYRLVYRPPASAGFPNVGKSSLINSLKRSKAVNVGAMPGLTR